LVLMLVLLLSAGAAFAQAESVESGAEQEILRLLNGERESRGLAPLDFSEGLREAARRHSQRMAADRVLGHQLPGESGLERRLTHESQHFDVSGENVAFAADAARAHSALMHSTPHRANILDRDYNSVGIGVVRSGGEIYVTEDFAHLVAASSVGGMEEQVASDLNRRRQASGEPLLRRVQAPGLRHRACEMAARDELNPSAGMLDGASSSVAFTASDPDDIAISLRSLHARRASAFAVGACYRSSDSYDTPVYWILVVTYM
jgi:Cysteine-rich secretory protein family